MHHVWWMDLEYCTYSQYHNFNGLIGIHGSLVYFVILLNVFVISNELCHLLRLFQYLSPLICDTFIHQYPFTHTPDACTYPPMYVYTVYIHGCTFNSKTMITVWNSVVICFSFIWVCVLFQYLCVVLQWMSTLWFSVKNHFNNFHMNFYRYGMESCCYFFLVFWYKNNSSYIGFNGRHMPILIQVLW